MEWPVKPGSPAMLHLKIMYLEIQVLNLANPSTFTWVVKIMHMAKNANRMQGTRMKDLQQLGWYTSASFISSYRSIDPKYCHPESAQERTGQSGITGHAPPRKNILSITDNLPFYQKHKYLDNINNAHGKNNESGVQGLRMPHTCNNKDYIPVHLSFAQIWVEI